VKREPGREAAIIRRRLLRWYDRNKRKLPWRGRIDPYAVLVSEVMLQQTTVAAVAPRYQDFLREFPDWRALARSGDDRLLAAWAGLGYYARARNLRAAARAIVRLRPPEFPRDRVSARSLPGIGEYTAGAVLSIAYGLPEPALDGNVLRVLARLDGVREPVARTATRRRIDARVRTILSPLRAGDFNQALMDLGALVCTPSSPRCADCPLETHCVSRREGWVETIPRLAPRRDAVSLSAVVAIVRAGNRLLLVRDCSPHGGSFWECPGTVAGALRGAGPRAAGPAALRSWLRDRGVGAATERPIGEIRHTVTHRRLRIRVRALRAPAEIRGPGLRWFTPAELRTAPVGTITRKALALEQETARRGRRTA